MSIRARRKKEKNLWKIIKPSVETNEHIAVCSRCSFPSILIPDFSGSTNGISNFSLKENLWRN
jgi:hypothetical protein